MDDNIKRQLWITAGFILLGMFFLTAIFVYNGLKDDDTNIDTDNPKDLKPFFLKTEWINANNGTPTVYYQFDTETNGSNVIDFNGAYNLTNNGQNTFTTGKIGNALKISTTGGVDSLQTATVTPFQFGTGNFTVAMWINVVSCNDQGIVRLGGGGANQWQILCASTALALESGGTLHNSGVTITGQGWKYITAVREGTGSNQFKWYVNGINVYNGTMNTDVTSTAEFEWISYPQYYVDEFAVYKGYAWNTSDVLIAYNNTAGRQLNISTAAPTPDTVYPTFYNSSYSPINNSNFTEGALYNFTISINNTNGTAGISWAGTNYTLSNSSRYDFNKTFLNLSANTYTYYFWAYGNGTAGNYNQSINYAYTITSSVPSPPSSSGWINTNGTPPTVYYQFDTEANGTTGIDYFGRMNLTNDGNTVFSYGKIGKAAKPAASLTTFYHLPNESYTFYSNNFTIAFWMNATACADQGMIRNGDGSAGKWQFVCTSGSKVRFEANSVQVDSVTNAKDSTWHYVVVTRGETNQSHIKLYLDGVNEKNGSISANLNSLNNFEILGYPTWMVDELAIYNNYAWNTSDVLTAYNSGSGKQLNVTVDEPSTDSIYPIFSNISVAPSNNTLFIEGALYNFTLLINNTNGTSGLSFNNVNYTLINTTLYNYNKTLINISAGTYPYYYWAYGNGTSNNYNQTTVSYYTVATAPINQSWITAQAPSVYFKFDSTFNVGANTTDWFDNIVIRSKDSLVTYNTGVIGLGAVVPKADAATDYNKFNGTGSDMTVFLPGTGNFTLSFWFKSSDCLDTGIGGLDGRIAGAWDIVCTNPTYNYAINYRSSNVDRTLNTSSVNIRDGNWHHIVITRRGTEILRFQDGVHDGSGNDSTNLNNANTLRMASTNGNTQYDEWAFWKNYSLTNSEIALVYNSGSGRELNSSAPPSIISNIVSPPNNTAFVVGQSYNFNVTVTGANTISKVIMTFNNVNYTATNISTMYNASVTNLGAGTYPYSWWANDSSNLITTSDTYYYTVGKATPTINFTINPPNNVVFGTNTNFSCSASSSGTIILKDGATDISSQIGASLLRGAGTYNLNCSYSGNQNYTAIENITSYVINQSVGNVSLLLNGTANNITITYPSQVNASASTLYGTSSLFRNGVAVTNSVFANLGVGFYNFTANSTGNQNYSTATITRWANITKASYALTLSASPSWNVNNVTQFTITCSENAPSGDADIILNLTRNGVQVTNPNIATLVTVGLYQYNCTGSAGANYSAPTMVNATLNVSQYASSISVTLNNPLDNAYLKNPIGYFNWSYSLTTLNLTNYTFRLWNSSNYLLYNNFTVSMDNICYQETANSSTSVDGNCELNYTGSYNISGDTGHLNITPPNYLNGYYDGNWSTSLDKTGDDVFYDIIYIKPKFAVMNGTIWQVKDEIDTFNISIPQSCWDYSPTNISFYISQSFGLFWYCKNNTNDAVLLRSYVSPSPIFEEAMYWNIAITTSANYVSSLSDGNYTWGVSACGNSSAGDNECTTSANRSIIVDSTKPIPTLLYPRGTGLGYVGQSVSMNFSYIETYPGTCGYQLGYLNASNGPTYYNTTVSCSANSSFTMNESIARLNGPLVLWMNDTAGNFNSTISSKLFDVVEYDQNFSTLVNEMSYNTFIINLSYNSTNYVNAVGTLNYNGTNVTSTRAGSGDVVTFTSNATVGTDTGDKDFFWYITLTNGTGSYTYISKTNTQALSGLQIAECNTTLNYTLVNFTIYDAQLPSRLVNSSFYTTIKYWSGSYSSNYRTYNYSHAASDNYRYSFCGSSGNTTYTVDADIRFVAPGYSENYHFYNDVDLSTNVTTQTLYLLNSSEATVTELQVIDEYQNGIADQYIQIQYYDVGSGTYYLVGMAKTNYEGKDLVYLNWYDTYYKFIGVDQDGEVIFNYNPYKVGATPQIFKVSGGIDFTYDKFEDITYTLYFNNASKNVVLTFLDPSGRITHGCLKVSRMDVMNSSIVYDECLASTSGTLTYNMGANNGSYTATFYAKGSFSFIKSIQFAIDIAYTIYETLEKKDSAVYAFLIVGGSAFLGLFSPAMAIFAVIAGWIGATWFGFIKMTAAQTVVFIGIAIMGIYLAWKMRN